MYVASKGTLGLQCLLSNLEKNLPFLAVQPYLHIKNHLECDIMSKTMFVSLDKSHGKIQFTLLDVGVLSDTR